MRIYTADPSGSFRNQRYLSFFFCGLKAYSEYLILGYRSFLFDKSISRVVNDFTVVM